MRILKLTAVSFVIFLSACAINKFSAPEDWPQDIAITVHNHEDGVSLRNACAELLGGLDAVFTMPYSCVWVDLCKKTCDVHVEAGSFSFILNHELGHCAGKDHWFTSTFADVLKDVKAGVCQQTSSDHSNDATIP